MTSSSHVQCSKVSFACASVLLFRFSFRYSKFPSLLYLRADAESAQMSAPGHGAFVHSKLDLHQTVLGQKQGIARVMTDFLHNMIL